MPIIFPAGQEGISEDLRRRLEAASEVFGQPMRLTSAHQGRPGRPGSQHPLGNAGDVDMSGMDNAARARLVEVMRAQGIPRYGTYDKHPNMLHVDMSQAQGGPWFMHNTTNRQLGNAPDWFRAAAATDVRTASNMAGSTDTDRTPSGDPGTGRMTPPRAQTMLPSMPAPGPQEPSTPDWFTPIVSLLAGAAMSRGGGLDRVLSGAALAGTGIAATQTAENELYDLRAKRADAQRKRQGQDSIDMFGQQLEQHPDPQMRQAGAMIRMNPEAGFRIYSEMQKSQAEAAQSEKVAQMFEAQGDHRSAALARMGGKVGTIDTKGPSETEYGTKTETVWNPDAEKWEVHRYHKGSAKPDIIGTPGPGVTQDPEQKFRMEEGGARGGQYGKLRATEAEALRTSISQVKDSRAMTGKLLRELEAGIYDGKTGPIVGRIKQYFDPDTAVMRANSTQQGMEKLGIYNLKPVSNVDMGFVMQLGSSHLMDPKQNMRVLRDYDKWMDYKEKKIRAAMDRIRSAPSFEDYLLDPVGFDIPEWALPYSAEAPSSGAGVTTPPATASSVVEDARKLYGDTYGAPK